MIETGGWDTHADQRGRLGAQLRGLDAMVGALKTGLGADWANTLGPRRHRIRPHRRAQRHRRHRSRPGLGGDAARRRGRRRPGRRRLAGPSTAALYEGRDLKPTTDLDALIASAVAQHYGLDPARAMATLFPETRGTAFAQSLITA